MKMTPWLKDTIERVASTYLEALVALVLANTTGAYNIDFLRSAALSALPAALAVLKAAVATQVGDKGTAGVVALAPPVEPAPPPPAPSLG